MAHATELTVRTSLSASRCPIWPRAYPSSGMHMGTRSCSYVRCQRSRPWGEVLALWRPPRARACRRGDPFVAPGIMRASTCVPVMPWAPPALNPIACYEVQRRGDRVIVGSKQSLPPGKPPPKSPASLSSSGPALRALQRRNGFDISVTAARSR